MKQDYLVIRIPKKDDVPIVTYKGKLFKLPEYGLVNLHLDWRTATQTKTTKPANVHLTYLDEDGYHAI
ncbi:hypothetical protein [Pediococcus inopinatus]|uniref:hypothetical protein n=1 Tax=Pediococcus inopinatus TaxID=114090 RepID=UPI0007C45A8E|nr:hypothetical protein [Pediococcus inopinatus]